MRKVFGSLFALSLTLALVLGTALAWSASGTGRLTTQLGTMGVSLTDITPEAAVIYPDGASWPTYSGSIAVTGASGMTATVTGGSVSNFGATGDGTCDAWLAQFAGGGIQVTGSTTWTSRVWMPTYGSGEQMPDVCQGRAFSYDVAVHVTATAE